MTPARFKKIRELQATLGVGLPGARAVHRMVSLSNQSDVPVTRERIEIDVNDAMPAWIPRAMDSSRAASGEPLVALQS